MNAPFRPQATVLRLVDPADPAEAARIEGFLADHPQATPFHRPAWLCAVAEGTGNRAGGGIGQNAPTVVGEMHAPSRSAPHRHGADDATAHADAMGAAEQADQEQGEETGIRHRTAAPESKTGSLT